MTYKLFVSYAFVDNGGDAWVTHFIDQLKDRLGKDLGRKELFKFEFFDKERRGNRTLTKQIRERLDEATAFLAFVSQGYKVSKWCEQELSYFLERRDIDSGCVWPVRLDATVIEAVTVPGYDFWLDVAGRPKRLGTPEMVDREKDYHLGIGDMSWDLKDWLLEADAGAAPAQVARKRTVYIADASKNLQSERRKLERSLKQDSVRVLPARNHPYEVGEKLVKDHLREATVFVQLLDEERQPGTSLAELELARQQNVAVLQWRRPGSRSTGASASQQPELTDESSVIVSSMTDFETSVKDKVAHLSSPPPPQTSDVLVFINAGDKDFPLVEQAKLELDAHDISWSRPLEPSEARPEKALRADFEQNVLSCDVILMFHHLGPVEKVRNQLLYCRAAKSKRERPLTMFAVCASPTAEPLNLSLKDVEVINMEECCADFCIDAVIQRIQQKRA